MVSVLPKINKWISYYQNYWYKIKDFSSITYLNNIYVEYKIKDFVNTNGLGTTHPVLLLKKVCFINIQ